MDIAQEMWPKMKCEFEKISMSRWTITRRIDDLASDISDTLRDKAKNFVSWSFAMDESMDQKDTAQLAIFVKGVDKELNETEELLSMKGTTTGADILTEILGAFDKFGLDLSNLCGLATDGARSMSGTGIGFVGLSKSALKERNINDDIVIFHHVSFTNKIIHQQNLCAKSLKFKHVLDPVIKAVACYDDFTNCGKKFKGRPIAEMEDENWLCELAFLVDITVHLNELNTKLQRKSQYANEMYGHIKGFMNKLRLWISHMQTRNVFHFPTLRDCGMNLEKKTEFVEQLEKLLHEFSARFKDFKSHEHLFEIFSSPFNTDVDRAPAEIQLELIDLQQQSDLKEKYLEKKLGDFYRKHLTQDDFPHLKKFIASKMALFGSTYLCEQFFSKMGFMKSPYRSVLTDEHLENGLRIASTSFEANLEKVVGKMSQLQISH
ncbi:general transcription factor II-I repeat domain-containing protein 2-like [Clavelina lepadiformis]|uniref:general transcription factor II-I repeat domain-containing protein 2-like n=1 Tax=Clavelina lepadiformis TaxID=159417 RepID=UPI0040412640